MRVAKVWEMNEGGDGPEGKLEKLVRNRIVLGGGIEFLLRTLFVVLIHNSIL